MAKGLYVGRGVDPASGKPGGSPLELDPDDLLTHGMIVGMTGSGKTGLAIVMLEELLRQGVPVIAIDPKGDLANLLLLFDKLEPSQFEPWIDAGAARREGKDVKTAAAEAAAAWTKGLADWNLGAADIAALLKTHDSVIYTPGSSAGVALNVLQSLEAPKGSWDAAEEDLRDEIQSIVSGLLTLVKVEADPLQSPPAVFLASLIEHGWRAGKGFSLESLIGEIADPPFDKIGALPLETAFPRKERQRLMTSLNTLLASPSFEAWRKGEPLDVARMLGADGDRPRLAVVSTAHLDDGERLCVTALLLDKVKTWMRRQGGTTALRALVYMDEVFGYFPPHPANPPTKRPLLTLLKQARAQGVGVVLATQNPVDLDYKGLANMGTWLVGTLQTQQDRERLAGGLASAGLEGKTAEKLLGATKKRVFLLHDVHRPKPELVQSRWAMSYLRGPLTREEIARLMKGQAKAARAAAPKDEAESAPVLPPPFRHHYLSRHGAAIAEPHVLVKYAARYKGSDESVATMAWPLAGASPLEALEAEPFAVDEKAVTQEPPAGIRYGELPGWLGGGGPRELERALKSRLPDKLTQAVFHDPVTDQTSRPGETREAFAARLASDGGGDAVRTLRQKLEKKKNELAMREQEVTGRRQEKWMAVGSAVLNNIGLIFGKKRTVTGVSSVLTKNRMEDNAEARLEALRAEVAALEAQLAQASEVDPARFEEQSMAPVRGGVTLLREDLVWIY
jgi:uncharacterized protein DUF87